MKKIDIKFLKPFSDAVGKSELSVDFDGGTLYLYNVTNVSNK